MEVESIPCNGYLLAAVGFFDEGEDLVFAGFFNCAGNKMLWQELPCLFHRFQKILHVLTYRALIFLIAFGEYEAEGNLPYF